MKNYFGLLFLIILLSGCTTLEVKISEPIRDVRFGIAYDVRYKPQLCQSHTGFTVFNNFKESYDLEIDLKRHISIAFSEGIKSVGSTPIILEPTPDIWNGLTKSTWDGTPSLSDQAKQTLLDAGTEFNLDYVLVSFHDPWPPSDEPDFCKGIYIQTGGNTYGMPFFSGVSAGLIFNAKTGNYGGTARLRNDAYDVDFPEDPKQITEEEIQYYIDIAAQFAEGSIAKFIESTWN